MFEEVAEGTITFKAKFTKWKPGTKKEQQGYLQKAHLPGIFGPLPIVNFDMTVKGNTAVKRVSPTGASLADASRPTHARIDLRGTQSGAGRGIHYGRHHDERRINEAMKDGSPLAALLPKFAEVPGSLIGRLEEFLHALIFVDMGRAGCVDESKSMIRDGDFSPRTCIGASFSASAARNVGTL
jgi:hypothetical protein